MKITINTTKKYFTLKDEDNNNIAIAFPGKKSVHLFIAKDYADVFTTDKNTKFVLPKRTNKEDDYVLETTLKFKELTPIDAVVLFTNAVFENHNNAVTEA